MKRLRKINLSALSHDELLRQEQRQLKGGRDCLCTCTCNSTCACSYVSQASTDTVITSHPVTVANADTIVDENSQNLAKMTGLATSIS